VQIAKTLGAEVTGVDSTPKLDMLRSIGADHVIDYTAEEFTKGGQRYDRILDFVGRRSIFAHKRALRHDGVYAMVGGSIPRILQTVAIGFLSSKTGSKKMSLVVAKPNKEDLSHLAGLIEAGEITPVIDRRYELREVPKAFRRLGDGLAKGKLVITM